MTIEFLSPIIPVKIDNEAGMTRLIRDRENDLELGLMVSSPNTDPPYYSLTSIVPPGPHFHARKDITSNQARLVIKEEFSAQSVVDSMARAIAKTRHPSQLVKELRLQDEE